MHWRSGQSRVKREGSRFGTTDRIRKLQSPTESLGNPSNCRGCGQRAQKSIKRPTGERECWTRTCPVFCSRFTSTSRFTDSRSPWSSPFSRCCCRCFIIITTIYWWRSVERWIGRSGDRQPVATIAFCNLMLGFWLIATFIVQRTFGFGFEFEFKFELSHTQQAFHWFGAD